MENSYLRLKNELQVLKMEPALRNFVRGGEYGAGPYLSWALDLAEDGEGGYLDMSRRRLNKVGTAGWEDSDDVFKQKVAEMYMLECCVLFLTLVLAKPLDFKGLAGLT